MTVAVVSTGPNQRQTRELISKLTDAVAEVTSEKLRDHTWVIIDEVKDYHWGVAGNPTGLDDVKSLIAKSQV